MRAADIERLVDERIAAHLDQHTGEMAAAVGNALRTYGNRPASEKGALTLKFGVVSGVGDNYADVTIDGQTAPTSISTITPPVEGDRVGVLFAPPSGAVVLGGGGSAFVGDDGFWEFSTPDLHISPGLTGIASITIDPAGAVNVTASNDGGMVFTDDGGGIYYDQDTTAGSGGVYYNLAHHGGFFLNDGDGGPVTGDGPGEGIFFNTTGGVGGGGHSGGFFVGINDAYSHNDTNLSLSDDTGDGFDVFINPVGEQAFANIFAWSRPDGGGFEGGIILDTGNAVFGGSECYFQVYTAGTAGAFMESLSQLANNHAAEFDLNAEEGAGGGDFAGFTWLYARADWIVFENDAHGPGSSFFGPAPDTALDGTFGGHDGAWSLGWNGTNFIIKVNDAGTIKAVTLTPV